LEDPFSDTFLRVFFDLSLALMGDGLQFLLDFCESATVVLFEGAGWGVFGVDGVPNEGHFLFYLNIIHSIVAVMIYMRKQKKQQDQG